jgi:predicted ester cyclase
MEIKQLNTTLDGHSFLLSNLHIMDGDKPAVRLLFDGHDSGNIFGSTIYHAM